MACAKLIHEHDTSFNVSAILSKRQTIQTKTLPAVDWLVTTTTSTAVSIHVCLRHAPAAVSASLQHCAMAVVKPLLNFVVRGQTKCESKKENRLMSQTVLMPCWKIVSVKFKDQA